MIKTRFRSILDDNRVLALMPTVWIVRMTEQDLTPVPSAKLVAVDSVTAYRAAAELYPENRITSVRLAWEW